LQNTSTSSKGIDYPNYYTQMIQTFGELLRWFQSIHWTEVGKKKLKSMFLLKLCLKHVSATILESSFTCVSIMFL